MAAGAELRFIPAMGNNWFTWALLSAVAAALTAVLTKIGATGVSANMATAVRTVVVLVFAWGLVFVGGDTAEFAKLSRRNLVFLTLSGIATGLSWIAYVRALQLGEASKVASIDKLSLLFVLVFSVMVLREPLSAKTLIGAALICCGGVVLALK